ncbi:MAG: hypothetical protein ACJA01_003390 [Saprospiraceae bacterium]|jgi:hypothetical protein
MPTTNENVYSNIIPRLSTHLFWDVDLDKLNWNDHKAFIFQKAIMYGKLVDWEIIKSSMSKDEMRNITKELRDLDDRSLSFLCLFLSIDPKECRCYIDKQSPKNFWKS